MSRRITMLIIMVLMCVSVFAQDTQSRYDFLVAKYKEQRYLNLDSAKHYATNLLLAAKTQKQKAIAYYYLGYVAKEQHLFHESAIQYRKALKNSYKKGFALSVKGSLADALRRIGQVDEAFELARDVQQEREKSGHPKVHYAYNVLAKIFFSINQLDSARHYFHKSIEARQTLKDKRVLAGSYWSLAGLHLRMYQKSKDSRHLDDAISLQMQSVVLRRGSKKTLSLEIANCLAKISRYHYLKRDYEAAMAYADSSLAIDHKHIPTKVEARTNKADIFEAIGQVDTAQVWYEKANNVINELLEDKTLTVADRVAFEKEGATLRNRGFALSRKKNRENAGLREELRRQTNIGAALIFLIVLIFAFVLLYITKLHRVRVKEKQVVAAKLEQGLSEQKAIAERNLESFIDLGKENERLRGEVGRKNIEFLSQIMRAEYETRVVQMCQNLVSHKVDHEKMGKRLEAYLDDMSRLDTLMDSFALMYPFFFQYLDELLEQRGEKLEKKQRVVCVLIATKTVGGSNAAIQNIMGYASHEGLKSIKKRIAPKLGTTPGELDDLLIGISKKKPSEI